VQVGTAASTMGAAVVTTVDVAPVTRVENRRRGTSANAETRAALEAITAGARAGAQLAVDRWALRSRTPSPEGEQAGDKRTPRIGATRASSPRRSIVTDVNGRPGVRSQRAVD
jgi:hypothetical protein